MVMIRRLHVIARPIGRRCYASTASPQALDVIDKLKEHLTALDFRGRTARDGAPRRADVVDAKLCDDVINYLAPTLEPYKGCTIIDVNPGACLWSETLHRFLKPKCHVLMEPDGNYVKGFIKPLLDLPNSTYRHTTMAGAHSKAYWHNYRSLLTDGDVIPPRPPLAADDPRLEEVDYSLLVTGNLARKPSDRMSLNSVGFAQLILQHMTWAGLSKQLMHTRGRVRMLWWVPEPIKIAIAPVNIALSGSFERAINFGAKVDEVVGMMPRGSQISNLAGSTLLEQANGAILKHDTEIVTAKMKQIGMQLPKDREPLSALATLPDDPETFRSPYELCYPSTDSLMEAMEVWEDRWSRRPASTMGRNRVKLWDAVVWPLQFPQAKTLVEGAQRSYVGDTMLASYATSSRAMMYVDMIFHAINIEVNFAKLEQDGKIPAEQAAELRKRIIGFAEQLDDNCYWSNWDKVVLEQLARFQTPARGAYHNRSYQALRAKKADFFPENEMTLLDMVPRDMNLTIPDLAARAETVKAAQELLKHLFTHKLDSIVAALDRLAPNCAQDLLPEMPSVTDPLRGGRLDPRFMPVRMMTDEMYEQFLRAWFEWPFKPSQGQLALSMESGGGGGARLEATTPEAVTGFFSD